MKILFVEDEQSLRKPVTRYLEKKNFIVDEVEDGKEALFLASQNSYDCILLDLNLPSMDGLEIASKLREQEINTPIIMVTARSQLYNKLDGFESGADDYITKPFNLRELVARINALIKRNSSNQSVTLRLDKYEIYPEQNVVKESGTDKEIELSNKEMGVLEYLLRNRDRIISAEELLEHIWDREIDIFSDTVKTHIKTLRKKIDPNKKYIKTVRGKGYRI